MKSVKRYYVYILECADQKLYTGITNDWERRLDEHQAGYDPKSYTYRRRPVQLVFLREFQYVDRAIAFEKQIKGWSNPKKWALIHEDYDLLQKLSECKNDSHWERKGR